MQFIMLLAFHIAIVHHVAVEGLHMRGQTGAAYTFEEFVHEFGREYEADSKEYTRRRGIFFASLSQIHATNSRANRSWTAGVHPFMDWTSTERSERLFGYDPSTSRRSEEDVALQTGAGATPFERTYGGSDDRFEAEAPPPRNQGGLCGSCWAFAAVEAVEAQLMKPLSPWSHEKGKPRLSAQTLVDCVPNPKHCGGTGGCGGATPQLAFDFMQSRGVPLEQNVPYSAETGKCPLDPYPPGWTRVTVTGWRQLPRNQAQPLMRAIVKDGPVAVAADAHQWAPYRSGIYDECPKNAVPNHAVLARGYGVAGGRKYWLIQNSWGSKWGEGGAIRLFRHDDEDSWCGIDSRPQEGSACDGEAHQEVTICGSCGLLYDAVIPQVGSVTVEPLAYSTDSATADAAAASLAAEANSEQGTGIPQLNEWGLVDPQAATHEIHEPISIYESPQPSTMPWQATSAAESEDPHVSIASESTTDAPIAGNSRPAETMTVHPARHAQRTYVHNLAAQDITAARAVDAWSSLSDGPLDVHPAEDAMPRNEISPIVSVYATPLHANSVGMANGKDFDVFHEMNDHTSMTWPSAQAIQAGLAAQAKRHGVMWSEDVALLDPPQIETATAGFHNGGSKPQIDRSLASYADRSATSSGVVLPSRQSASIDAYLRR